MEVSLTCLFFVKCLHQISCLFVVKFKAEISESSPQLLEIQKAIAVLLQGQLYYSGQK